jgi:hypothetical protein
MPVVIDGRDGAAAQPDEDIEASEVDTEKASDGRSVCAVGGFKVVAALRGARGSDRGWGSAGRDGGSKGLR